MYKVSIKGFSLTLSLTIHSTALLTALASAAAIFLGLSCTNDSGLGTQAVALCRAVSKYHNTPPTSQKLMAAAPRQHPQSRAGREDGVLSGQLSHPQPLLRPVSGTAPARTRLRMHDWLPCDAARNELSDGTLHLIVSSSLRCRVWSLGFREYLWLLPGGKSRSLLGTATLSDFRAGVTARVAFPRAAARPMHCTHTSGGSDAFGV